MKKEKVFNTIIIIFFILFVALLIAQKSGYYQNKSSRNKTLTEEQIKAFEEDIKNGKEIDIKDYTTDNNINYSNELSNNIYKISLKIEEAIDSTIKYVFNKAAKSVNN
jgi:hypothetical protein